METYLIWSIEHRAWWRPGRMGYTIWLDAAGVYSRDEAMQIVDDATMDWSRGAPNEVPVRIADLPDAARAILANKIAPFEEGRSAASAANPVARAQES